MSAFSEKESGPDREESAAVDSETTTETKSGFDDDSTDSDAITPGEILDEKLYLSGLVSRFSENAVANLGL